jgi:hypothetical protein
MTTTPASSLRQRSALPDLENLFGDATPQAQSTTQTSTGSSQWSMPTDMNSIPMTHAHQPSTADPGPTNIPDDGNLGTIFQGLPGNAKIGLIVGIVVIVALSVLGCGMCFLDCRRRQQKRKERRTSRQAESTMLEMEMRNGHTEQRRVRRGLWDHLKPASGDGGVNLAEAADTETRHAAMRTNARGWRNDSTVESSRSNSVASRSPAVPRDRVSVVSSVPSVVSPVGVRPALPQSFLDDGARR